MPTAKNFFTEAEQKMLVQAIAKAEEHTSGEIRLHIENFCPGNELTRAKKVFTALKMDATSERNGVLIYIATLSHKIAVIGDEGIHQKVQAEFWNTLVKDLIKKFKEGRKAEALSECIIECGAQLGKYFPRKNEDKDELSNTISY